MTNFLLISSNLSESLTLVNKLIYDNPNLRLSCISSSVMEIISFLNNHNNEIDFILVINYSITDLNAIFHDLESNNTASFINSFIIISKNNPKIIKKYKNYIKTIINYEDYFILRETIHTLIQNDNKPLFNTSHKNFVLQCLCRLGYNPSHIGTIYLLDVISYLISNNYKTCPNLSKYIYPIISSYYSTSSHNVKCDITSATKHMNTNNSLTSSEKVKNFKSDEYISTKAIINYILVKTAIIPK